jgi:hypothetical protein
MAAVRGEAGQAGQSAVCASPWSMCRRATSEGKPEAMPGVSAKFHVSVNGRDAGGSIVGAVARLAGRPTAGVARARSAMGAGLGVRAPGCDRLSRARQGAQGPDRDRAGGHGLGRDRRSDREPPPGTVGLRLTTSRGLPQQLWAVCCRLRTTETTSEGNKLSKEQQ